MPAPAKSRSSRRERQDNPSREAVKAELLACARRLVRKEGFEAVQARRLASEVGCAIGTIYNLYRNLDELIVILNGETLDALTATLQAAVPGDGDGSHAPDPRARVLALTGAYVRFTLDHAAEWNVLFEHRLPAGEDLPPDYLQKIARLLAMVEEALAPLFPAEATAERRQGAALLWSSLHGICSLGSSGKLIFVSSDSVVAMGRRLVETLLDGLGAQGGPPRAGRPGDGHLHQAPGSYTA